MKLTLNDTQTARLISILTDMPFGALAGTRAPWPSNWLAHRSVGTASQEPAAWLLDWLQALNGILEEHTAGDRARDMKLAGYEEALRGLGGLIRDAQALLR